MGNKFINANEAYEYDDLACWYQSSIDETPPVWTDEHLEELLNDFYVIPKDTPFADVVEVKHGENITSNHPVDEFICSECGLIMRDCCRYEIDEDDCDEICYEFAFRYCPRCGTKIDIDG